MAGKKKEKTEEVEVRAESLAQRALDLKNKINKEKGRVVVQTYSEDDDTSIKRVSSGIPKLDRILGRGSNGYGWAIGRMHGISGPESVGKSSITLASIASAQKQLQRICVLVDAECVYDPGYAKVLGVDVDELLVINPDTAEEAFDTVESLIKTGDVGMIVIDSLDGLTPKAIIEASAEDQFMGLNARVNNRFITKVQPLLRDNECTLIIVSQIREKIGVMYGNPETVQGGRGLKFYASTRLEVRRDEEIKENGNPIGHTIKCKTVKNKTASPQQTTYARLDWGKGFNKFYDLIDLAVQDGIVVKGGAGWYSYQDKKIQGDVNFVKELESNPQMYNEILEKLGM